MDEQMFCFQCEQAAHCTACTGKAGVCGKSADTAAAQDRLTGALISYASQLIGEGRAPAPEQALLLMEGLFTTITNVNFDPQTVDQLTESIHAACPGIGFDYDMANLWHEPDEDIRSLKSFVLFSLRGMAAYNYHARVLGRIDPELDRFFCEALQAVGSECSIDTLWALVQKTGKASYRCMELLDAANTGAFGQPEPVEVPLVIEKGPFIVISGHDLYDMKCLLEQTAGKGVNIYTHGEMLPAHGYPELKKYPHLKGNFGTEWQHQHKEIADIRAPVQFTTNCLMPPRASYADRVFTTAVVSYPEITHIGEDKDFTPVIEKALALGGYNEDTPFTGINGGGTVKPGALVGRQVLIGNACVTVKENTASSMTVDAPVTVEDNAILNPGEAGAQGRDVYATLVLGADGYGTTELTGGGLEHIVKQLGSAGTGDPLNQRASGGWKATKVAVRLDDSAIRRIETCSTYTE